MDRSRIFAGEAFGQFVTRFGSAVDFRSAIWRGRRQKLPMAIGVYPDHRRSLFFAIREFFRSSQGRERIAGSSFRRPITSLTVVLQVRHIRLWKVGNLRFRRRSRQCARCILKLAMYCWKRSARPRNFSSRAPWATRPEFAPVSLDRWLRARCGRCMLQRLGVRCVNVNICINEARLNGHRRGCRVGEEGLRCRDARVTIRRCGEHQA